MNASRVSIINKENSTAALWSASHFLHFITKCVLSSVEQKQLKEKNVTEIDSWKTHRLKINVFVPKVLDKCLTHNQTKHCIILPVPHILSAAILQC
jgi:hypothetical protein